MAIFGEKTMDCMVRQYQGLLLEHATEMDAAYARLGDEPLSISLTVKVSPGAVGNNAVETSMSCVTDRLKDKAKGKADEGQRELFGTQDEG